MNTEPEITLALEHLHKALSERLKVLERDLQKVKDDIPAQVEKRKQLALNLKLAEKLLIVYETVAYFHAYEKTPPQPIESLVSNITSTLKPFYLRAHGPYTGSMQETVQFELHHKAYSLEFNKREDSGWFMDDYSYLAGPPYSIHIGFHDNNGKTLFTGQLSDRYSRISVRDISAFILGA